MNSVVNFSTKRKPLSAQELFNNATGEGQEKIVIASLSESGRVGVWSSDMLPMELSYLCRIIQSMAGEGATDAQNTKHWHEDFEE